MIDLDDFRAFERQLPPPDAAYQRRVIATATMIVQNRRRTPRFRWVAVAALVAALLVVGVLVAGRLRTKPTPPASTVPLKPVVTFRHVGEVAIPEPGVGIVGIEPRSGARRTLITCTAPCTAVDHPVWSPDGDWLAFRMFRTDDVHRGFDLGSLAILGGDGRVRRIGIDGVGLWSWAPDSSAILADGSNWARKPRGRGVWLIDPTTGRDHRLARLDYVGAADIMPVWAPDSRHVAYVTADRHGHREIVRQPIDGKPRVLWQGPHDKNNSFIAWSPAGDRIAVENDTGTSIIDLTGKPIATRLPGRSPVWSPSGSHLVLLNQYEFPPLGDALVIASPDGAISRRLSLPANLPAFLLEFWTADETAVVIRTSNGWYTVGTDGSRPRPISVLDAYRLFQEDTRARLSIFNTPPLYVGPNGPPP